MRQVVAATRRNALVDEARRAELRDKAVAKDLAEPALVVVELALLRVVFASNVEQDSRLLPLLGVARTADFCLSVLGQDAEHGEGERIVGVEGAAVRRENWRGASLLGDRSHLTGEGGGGEGSKEAKEHQLA